MGAGFLCLFLLTEYKLENILNAPKEDRVIGFRQVKKAINGNRLRCVTVAEDIEEAIKSQIVALAKGHNVPLTTCRSRQELGAKLGIDVACAVCGVLKK